VADRPEGQPPEMDATGESPMADSADPPLRQDEGEPPPRHRLGLALGLLGLVAVVCVGAGVEIAFVRNSRVDVVVRILEVIFGPLVTLLGTSFTWYYASNGSHNRPR
jgi:hypothetical protein